MAANNANSLDDQGRLLCGKFTNNFLLMSDVKGLRREVNSTTLNPTVATDGNGSGPDHRAKKLKFRLRWLLKTLM